MPTGKEAVTATEAKNNFGLLLEKAIQGEVVVITKHDAPKAVMISMDRYADLCGASEARIDSLSAEFDSQLLRMQRPGARRSMQSAFNASGKELGRAAVTVARKRG